MLKDQSSEFWKQTLGSPSRSLAARHQILKIEGNKLRVSKNRLILQHIQEILDRQLSRTQIRNQLEYCQQETTEDLLQQLREFENAPPVLKSPMIEKDKQLLSIFALPQILKVLQTTDPQLCKQANQKLSVILAQYPKLKKALLPPGIGGQTTRPVDRYLEYRKLIECKELNEEDVYLLETEFYSMVEAKLKQRELGKFLIQLWKDGQELPVAWPSQASDIMRHFKQQKHS